MAISPGSYEFSGGAFMGGGSTPVERDDIHSLTLTRNGASIGNYNPLVGDTTIDIPDGAVIVTLDIGSGMMSGTEYGKIVYGINNGIPVVAVESSSSVWSYWKFAFSDPSGYSFQSSDVSGQLTTVKVLHPADGSGNHQITRQTAKPVIYSAAQSLTDIEKETARTNIGVQAPVNCGKSGMIVNSVTMSNGEVAYTYHVLESPGDRQFVHLKANAAAIVSFVLCANASDSTGQKSHFDIGVRFTDGTHVFEATTYRIPAVQSGDLPVPVSIVFVGIPQYEGDYYCEVCSNGSLTTGESITVQGTTTGSVQAIQFR